MQLLAIVALLLAFISAMPTNWKAGRTDKSRQKVVNTNKADLISYQKGKKAGSALHAAT
ncbi:hypothetical protein HDU91_005027, partial [Kappamyces sp. JEL0680]